MSVVLLLTGDTNRHARLREELERAGYTVRLAGLDLLPNLANDPVWASIACVLVDGCGDPRLLLEQLDTATDRRAPRFLLLEVGSVAFANTSLVDGLIFPDLGCEQAVGMVRLAVDGQYAQRQLGETAKLALLGKVSAGVLHDIKNPLHNLLGGLDRLIPLLPPEPSLHTWSEMMRRNGELLRVLLQELLAIFRDEQLTQPLALHEMLDRALRYAVEGDIAFLRHVQIQKVYATPAPIVQAAAGQLLRLFLNLIVNARQAIGDHDGVIAVHSSWTNSSEICLAIRDNGPGISPQVLPRLFQQAMTTKAEGSGVGLLQCHEIVRQLGGRIEGDNHPDGGACFRLWLPTIELA